MTVSGQQRKPGASRDFVMLDGKGSKWVSARFYLGYGLPVADSGAEAFAGRRRGVFSP
jgi:hypothetical protein